MYSTSRRRLLTWIALACFARGGWLLWTPAVHYVAQKIVQSGLLKDSLLKNSGAAPDFTLKDTNGKRVSLSDFKGKVVVLNFWATWCGPCKVEMPWFQEFQKEYAGQGLVILGLVDDVDAGKDTIAKVAEKAGVTYPILLADGKVQKAYGGVDVLPMSFYVDRNGVVVEETAGLGPKDEIEAHIKKAIASGGGATAAGGQ